MVSLTLKPICSPWKRLCQTLVTAAVTQLGRANAGRIPGSRVGAGSLTVRFRAGNALLDRSCGAAPLLFMSGPVGSTRQPPRVEGLAGTVPCEVPWGLTGFWNISLFQMKTNVLREIPAPTPAITLWDLTTAPVREASRSPQMAGRVRVRQAGCRDPRHLHRYRNVLFPPGPLGHYKNIIYWHYSNYFIAECICNRVFRSWSCSGQYLIWVLFWRREVYSLFLIADIDECALGGHSCHAGQDCENVIGAYHCVVRCGNGFRRTADGLSCQGRDRSLGFGAGFRQLRVLPFTQLEVTVQKRHLQRRWLWIFMINLARQVVGFEFEVFLKPFAFSIFRNKFKSYQRVTYHSSFCVPWAFSFTKQWEKWTLWPYLSSVITGAPSWVQNLDLTKTLVR